MADQDPINPNNGPGPEGEPQVAAIAQYIKDLSVESPNSPQVFQWGEIQPQVDVQFNIAANRAGDEVHEVVLGIKVSAKSDNGVHFLVELSYAGLFGIRNLPEESLGAFLLVEAPRLMFPFARQVVAEAVQNTGFPPLLLEPIDFGTAFLSEMEARQGKPGSGNGSGQLPPQEPPPGDSQG